MLLKKLIKKSWVRKIGIPAYRMYARQWRFGRGPRVLAMSMPKAGTHLLSRLLNHLPDMMFSGYHLSEEEIFTGDAGTASDATLNQALLESTLGVCMPGQYLTGHFPHVPALKQAIFEEGFVPLLILRDPRDVAVSYVHYVCNEPRHFHCAYYNNMASFDERLHATIAGFEANGQTSIGLASIGKLISEYAGWMDEPDVTVCRFENLVGPQGSGTTEAQAQAIKRIGTAIDRTLDEDAIQTVASKLFSARSRTFRSGKAGGWSTSFNSKHIESFKRIAGDGLIRLGYESDLSW